MHPNAFAKPTPPTNHRTDLRIHVVILSILLLLLHDILHNLLLLLQIHPVQRTRGVQLQPRLYTLQIEHMRLVTRQPHDERVLVVQERAAADRTAVIHLEVSTGYSLQFCAAMRRSA